MGVDFGMFFFGEEFGCGGVVLYDEVGSNGDDDGEDIFEDEDLLLVREIIDVFYFNDIVS